MKIGIAISLYDKFEDLAILVDIIRKNWKNKYLISVCSNHPEAKKRIKELNIDIDKFTQGQDIFFHPKKLNGVRKVVNLYCRVLDCIKNSCKGAEDLGADCIVHVHTDAWPLSEEGLLRIINQMKRTGKKVAARGFGLAKYGHDCPLGHIDDMFLIYDVNYFRKVRFFDFNSLEMMPTRLSIHGILATLIVSRVGVSKLYLYDDHTKLRYWDGEIKDTLVERALPSAFDSQTGFLHVNVGSFPEGYGRKLQAMYLQEYGLTKGKHIERFLKSYPVSKQQLLKELDEIERRMKTRIRLTGFPILSLGKFGRNFSKMQWYIDSPMSTKLKYIFISTGRMLWDRLISRNFGVNITPEYSVWPETLESFYSRMLDSSDYPDKSMVWFKRRGKSYTKNPVYRGFDVYW